jgi:RNA polymerase sigma factor (sigma-70 family)
VPPDSSHAHAGTDDDLALRRARANEATSALFEEFYALLVRYAMCLTRSAATAEEIVQETFVDLFRALLEDKAIENPKGWLLCAVRREAIDRLRKEARHGGDFVPLDGTIDVPAHAQTPPAELSGDRLGALLWVLTEREREVLLLRAKSLKYSEIASTLGIGCNSVKTLLARAIRKLRDRSKTGDGTGSQLRTQGYDRVISNTLQ